MTYMFTKGDVALSYLFEMHFHTPYTSHCGQVKPEEALPKYKEMGYAGVVVTDHYYRDWFRDYKDLSWDEKAERWLAGYKKALDAGRECGIVVILGMEIRFNDNINDHLVYGIDEEFVYRNKELYDLTYEEFAELCRSQGLFFAQAHPFRDICSARDPKYLNGVEIYNGNMRWNSHNDVAKEFAKVNGLVGISGSDFHEWEDLARGGTYLNKCPKDSKELARLLFEKEIAGYKET
ncbi:MAG TPA: PHP domain-containing protein [Clostridiales bacterium]|nr:PHP domain-containing protein [Clostridiales bacterium]